MAEHMTELLVGRRYLPSEKVVTLPFGVDTEHFNTSVRTPAIGSERPVVMSTRRLEAGLDVATFVRAVPHVLNKTGNAQFVIAGDGHLRGNLQKLAANLGVASQICFLGGIEHEQMPKLLGGADVFVSTSPLDGNNVSLNEAMACGAFPIVTDIAANRAFVRHGENGLAFSCGDEEELAKCIVQAVERPEWRLSVMQPNFEIVREKASWQHSMKVMEAHYLSSSLRHVSGAV